MALTGQQKKNGQMDMGGSIEESFVLPSGDGWKSRTQKKDSDQTAIFEKTFAVGAQLKGDLSLKENGDPILVNEVSVTRIAPRRFEYRETLRWTGPPPTGMNMKPEDLTGLKAALPKALASDENARGIADKMAVLIMPMMFDPAIPCWQSGCFIRISPG